MQTICRFDQPVRDFLVYLRVEAGMSPATLEAYGRDLRDLTSHLEEIGIGDPKGVKPQHLAEHVRYLHRERELDPRSIIRHLATLRVFFRFLLANRNIE